MARTIIEILEEIFKGNDSALAKYAKVRHTQYEINLWRRCGLPLKEVGAQERRYFRERFLKGTAIEQATDAERHKAFDELDHAIQDGCHKRCIKLVNELNEALEATGVKTIEEPEKFLDWLTFSYHTNKDQDGQPLRDPGYSFEIRVFSDDKNRKEFWKELQSFLKAGRIVSMQDICRIVLIKRSSMPII